MIVELASDVQSIVQNAVDTGRFETREDVVAAALRAWDEHRPETGNDAEYIQSKLQEALDRNGPYHTVQEAYSTLMERYRNWPQSDQPPR